MCKAWFISILSKGKSLSFFQAEMFLCIYNAYFE